MPEYRLKPRLPMWRLSALVLGLLMLPVLIDAALPQVAPNSSQVTLGMPGYEWSHELNWPDGTPMTCVEVDESFFSPAWDCDGTIITTMIMAGARDEDNTLQRGMRNALRRDVAAPISLRKGPARLIDAENAVGMSVMGEGDYAGQSLIAVVTGDNYREVSRVVWTSLVDPERIGRLANPQESA